MTNIFEQLSVATSTTVNIDTLGKFNEVFNPSDFKVKITLSKDATKRSTVWITNAKGETRHLVLSAKLTAHHRAGLFTEQNLGLQPIYKSKEGIFSIGMDSAEGVTAGTIKFVAPVMTQADYEKTATI